MSIILNSASVLILKGDAAESMNIKSAYLHLFTDVFTSVAVLAGGLAILYFNLTWIDSLLSIIIAIYLIYASYGFLMETLRVVMHFEAHIEFHNDISLSHVNEVFQGIQVTLLDKFQITHTVLQPEIGGCDNTDLLCSR